jgi:hypothetical protein
VYDGWSRQRKEACRQSTTRGQHTGRVYDGWSRQRKEACRQSTTRGHTRTHTEEQEETRSLRRHGPSVCIGPWQSTRDTGCRGFGDLGEQGLARKSISLTGCRGFGDLGEQGLARKSKWPVVYFTHCELYISCLSCLSPHKNPWSVVSARGPCPRGTNQVAGRLTSRRSCPIARE